METPKKPHMDFGDSKLESRTEPKDLDGGYLVPIRQKENKEDGQDGQKIEKAKKDIIPHFEPDTINNSSKPDEDEHIYCEIETVARLFNLNDPKDNPARFHPDFRRPAKKLSDRNKLYLGILLTVCIVIGITVSTVLGVRRELTNGDPGYLSNPTFNGDGFATEAKESPAGLILNVTDVNPDILDVRRVLARPEGGALVATVPLRGRPKVILIDNQGKTIKEYHTNYTYRISGLVLMGESFLILQRHGIITLKNLHSGEDVIGYNVEIIHISDGIVVNKTKLLLVDKKDGVIFEFNMENEQKDVKIKGLCQPEAIAVTEISNNIYYIVTELYGNAVSIYINGRRQTRIGGIMGNEDDSFFYPQGITILPPTNFLVCDYGNNRITEFNIDGEFEGNFGLQDPIDISYSPSNNMLWLVQDNSLKILQMEKMFR